MKKKFDVLAWIRKVRDGNYRRDRDLTPKQIIERTRVGAEAFRASRAKRKTAQEDK